MISSQDPHIALAALQFFSFSSESLIAALPEPLVDVPDLLNGRCRAPHRASNYVCGVGCTFVTYAWQLHDRFVSADQAPELTDFSHCLGALLHAQDEQWSEDKLFQTRLWRELRACAHKALTELHEAVPETAPQFAIKTLINPREFMTSEEARRLLE